MPRKRDIDVDALRQRLSEHTLRDDDADKGRSKRKGHSRSSSTTTSTRLSTNNLRRHNRLQQKAEKEGKDVAARRRSLPVAAAATASHHRHSQLSSSSSDSAPPTPHSRASTSKTSHGGSAALLHARQRYKSHHPLALAPVDERSEVRGHGFRPHRAGSPPSFRSRRPMSYSSSGEGALRSSLKPPSRESGGVIEVYVRDGSGKCSPATPRPVSFTGSGLHGSDVSSSQGSRAGRTVYRII